MAKRTRTRATNLPAAAKRREQNLIELYEREAYRTYNVALRTTCDHAAAARATEGAFLRHLAAEEAVDGEKAALLQHTVAAALVEAPRSPAKPAPTQRKRRSAEERLLEAAASLPPSERAAIALNSVGERTARSIATATGTTEKAAANLVGEARKSFAKALGIAADRLGPKLRDWPWLEPPAEVWDSLYPRAHRLLAERERSVGSTTRRMRRLRAMGKLPSRKTRVPSRHATPSPSPLATRLMEETPRLGTRFGKPLSGPGGVWAFRAAVLVIILTPAAIVALIGTSGKGGGDVALSAGGGTVPGVTVTTGEDGEAKSEGGSTYEALTAKELDQLRLEELEALREYSQAQTDRTLSADERVAAAENAEQLLALARQRLAEAERREQALEEREKKQGQQTLEPPSSSTPTPTTTGKKKKKNGKKKGDQEDATAPVDLQEECLMNPDGTLICPAE